jgi:glutathione S-transferase
MKLHFHPVSTASRPVVLFLAEANIPYEPVIVDLMTGAQKKSPFIDMNPSGLVPMLEDDGFILTESASILRYLAEKTNSPTYPLGDLKKRAHINERMDWFNTQLYREWGYHLAYPQLFRHHVRQPEAAQEAMLKWGLEKTEQWLTVLDKHFIGAKKYVCGDEITIADYFGSQILALDALIGASFKGFPNVDRWMNRMRELPNWKKVNEATDGFGASLRGKKFVTIGA